MRYRRPVSMKATVRSRVPALLFLTLLALPAFSATWYVNGEAHEGDGSRAAPFSTLPQAEKASAPGDTIVLVRVAAPYEQGIVLQEGQILTADGSESPVVRVTKGAAIAVRDAGNVVVRGIAIELADAGQGLALTNCKGTVAVQGGGIAGRGNGTAILIDGGDAAISFDGFPVAQSAGAAVVIRGHRGASVLFRNGSTIDVTAGTHDALALTENSGSYSFNDPVRIASRGAPALAVRDSGTFSVLDGSSTLSTAGSTAVRLSGTALAVHLASVTIDGGGAVADGVVLEKVSGTFAIGGGVIRNLTRRGISIEQSQGVTIRNVRFTNVPSANGAAAQICGSPAATGEHLQCGAAVHLHEAEEIALQDVQIEKSAQLAINGDTVRNLSLTNVEIRGTGNELNEHGLQLRNVSGELKLAGCRIEGSTSRQFHLVQDAGEAAVDIAGSAFGGSAPPNGGQGILIDARADARLRVAIHGSTFQSNFSNAVQLAAGGHADVRIDVLDSTFRKNAAAVSLAAAGASSLVYRIEGNTIEGSASTALNVHSSTSGTTHGDVAKNVIGVHGRNGSGAVCGGGCNGISVSSIGRGVASAVIAGNTIQQVDGGGIQARAGGDGSLAVRIAGNIVREPAGADTVQAIAVMAGMKRSDSAAVCVEVGGPGELANTVSGAWNTAGGGTSIALMKLFDRATLSIADYAGAPANTSGLAKFVAGRNHAGAVEAALGSGLTLSGRCPIP
jgi:hypothetical protein